VSSNRTDNPINCTNVGIVSNIPSVNSYSKSATAVGRNKLGELFARDQVVMASGRNGDCGGRHDETSPLVPRIFNAYENKESGYVRIMMELIEGNYLHDVLDSFYNDKMTEIRS